MDKISNQIKILIYDQFENDKMLNRNDAWANSAMTKCYLFYPFIFFVSAKKIFLAVLPQLYNYLFKIHYALNNYFMAHHVANM